MSVRRVRISGLPADFCVPPGWPVPSERWVRENALWAPPPAWRPIPGAPRPPTGWRFWTPNEGWSRYTAPFYRPIRKWALTANVLAAVWIITSIATALQPTAVSLRAVALAAFVAGIGFALAHRALWKRTTATVFSELALVAEEERTKRLTREYQLYLRDAA
ncbi:hypothetical protein [Microbacterium sp.]|uniref:hypothetical protein n=1 Tax=Microbacterium sp. TaxID=51671 RepID=UPI001ACB61B7|nr:hypothetical protein [Microbacterium sp.]MBN9187416.1 hypothetical protein [Microbacterium sp.]MBN9194016.1 hypothetical protein [Microbacterium sp.]